MARRRRATWRPAMPVAVVAVVGLWLVFLAVPGVPSSVRTLVRPAAAPLPSVSLPPPPVVTPSTGALEPAPLVDGAPGADGPGDSATTGPEPVAPQPVDAAPQPGAADIPRSGSGDFALAGGGSGVVGSGDIVVHYTVEVEGGLPYVADDIAARVEEILSDQRSWIGLGRWQLQRVSTGADARILIATPDTVDRLCAPLTTEGKYSCRNGQLVVLNAMRWAGGAQSWGTDVEGYRGYLVNHEFGHYLGYGHVPCPAPGAPAPVMLQQTKSVEACLPNAWPAVTGG